MLSKNPTESQSPSGAKTRAAVLSPRDPIEVAAGGNGTVNDPGASDNRPPGTT